MTMEGDPVEQTEGFYARVYALVGQIPPGRVVSYGQIAWALGALPGAYEVWESAFADTGSLILMQDNQDMSVVIGLAGTPLDAVMRNLLLQGYLPLKPEGVRVAWYAVAPERGPLLGWNCETGGLSGWGKGIWPVRLEPLP